MCPRSHDPSIGTGRRGSSCLAAMSRRRSARTCASFAALRALLAVHPSLSLSSRRESESNSTTAASITAAIASASVAAAAASRAAAAPFSLQAVVAVNGTRPCLQADSGWHTHQLIRTTSATFGLQVAWLPAPHDMADDAVEASLKWAAVPVAKRKSATVAQAPSPWQPPYSLLSPRGAPSQLPAPSHGSSRGRASATAPETRPWSRSETFTPRRRSDHSSLAAERSFGAVQTVRSFALLPKPLTRHAKTSELRIRTLGNGSSGGLQTCLAR